MIYPQKYIGSSDRKITICIRLVIHFDIEEVDCAECVDLPTIMLGYQLVTQNKNKYQKQICL